MKLLVASHTLRCQVAARATLAYQLRLAESDLEASRAAMRESGRVCNHPSLLTLVSVEVGAGRVRAWTTPTTQNHPASRGSSVRAGSLATSFGSDSSLRRRTADRPRSLGDA